MAHNTSRNLNIGSTANVGLLFKIARLGFFAILGICGVFMVTSATAAEQACAELGCNCEIAVGLIGQIEPFSAIHVDSKAQCLSFCQDSSLNWDRQNLSTSCSYQKKAIFKNEIGLLDINFADCRINGSLERLNLRTCRRNCTRLSQAPRLKIAQNPSATSAAPGECFWDGIKLLKDQP